MSIRRWLVDHLAGDIIAERVRLAVPVHDDKYWHDLSRSSRYTRRWAEIRDQLERLNTVCLTNPLASRIVSMTTEFVIGDKITVTGGDWVTRFWNHPLNNLNMRAYQWCDTLTRDGELFIVLSRNAVDGMAYVRQRPAILIDRIETSPDDYEHELSYHELDETTEGRIWPGPESNDNQIMLHYAINRLPGDTRGVSDLAQILTWLERYDNWLEDRVRINRYKGAFLWQVQLNNPLPGTLEAKRAQYARVPTSGSMIVTDTNETWTAVQPKIEADDVEADGKALRLMIAAGAGIPLHFLAEGESATRATAREMGTSTFRHFVNRQRHFSWMLENLITIAAQRAGQFVTPRVSFESVTAEYQPTGETPRDKKTPAEETAN
ncbi:MAG: hypothetical protein FJ278_01745 [Planctomycetes bacterium]|nr:hypothetical protein [Planctomycetota bacterium]